MPDTYQTLLEIEKAKRKRLQLLHPISGTYGTFTPPITPPPDTMRDHEPPESYGEYPATTRYREPPETYGEYMPPLTEQKILSKQQTATPPEMPPPPSLLPPPPPQRNWLQRGVTNVGKGVKEGLGELFQAVAMGPQNYQQMQHYKAMLPAQIEEENRKLAGQKELMTNRPISAKEQFAQEIKTKMENGTATDEEKQHFNIMMGAVPKQVKPEITLDQRINNLQQYINSIAPLDMRGRRQIPKDPEKLKIYNKASAELDSLIFKQLSSEIPSTQGGMTKESLMQEGFTPAEADEYLATQR